MCHACIILRYNYNYHIHGSCWAGNFGTSDCTRHGPALRVPTGPDATIRSTTQTLAPRTDTRPEGAAIGNAGGGRHPFMHVALVMDLAGCLFLGRALSVRRDRGVTSCAWGEACAHEHTWALKKMCSAAYARVVCMKIVDIKKLSGGVWKSLCGSSRTVCEPDCCAARRAWEGARA